MNGEASPDFGQVSFCLGDLRVFPNRQIVAEGHREIKVPPKVMAVLIVLAKQAPGVVTRESLIETLWDGNTYVGQRAVTDAIWRLRKILGQDAEGNALIETIPKRGYRLIQTPKSQPGNDPATATGTDRGTSSRHLRFKVRLGALALVLISAVVAWLVISNRFRAWPLSPAKLGKIPLTHYPGREATPNLSPNGRELAFTWEEQPGSSAIYRLELNRFKADPRPIGQGGAHETSPVWSPDGQRIAAIRALENRRQIVIHHLETEQTDVLATSPIHPLSGLAWTDGGQSLLYTASMGDSAGFLASWSLPLSRERRMSEPSGKMIPIAAKPSPDGNSIALIQRNLTNFIHDLVLVKQDTWHNLSQSRWDVLHFQWLPDGDGFLIATYQAPHTLFRLNLENPVLKPLARFESFDLTDFAFGNHNILYAARSNTRGHLRTFSFSQNRPTDFTTSLGNDHSPNWSNAVEKLVFISTRSGSPQLWTTGREGRNPTRLTDFPSPLWQPSWSPNGEFIVFVGWTAATDHHDLYLLATKTGDIQQLTGDDFHYMGIPSWSADGKGVYIGRMKDSIWHLCKIEVANRQVTGLPIEAFYAQETADGTHLYYCRNGQAGLWRRDWAPDTKCWWWRSPFSNRNGCCSRKRCFLS